jgi:zinc resistance-associated protein
MSRKFVLALTTTLCAAALVGVASAQAPATAPQSAPLAAPGPQSEGGQGMGRGMGRGMSHGMSHGGMHMQMRREGRGYGRNMSEQDRAAFFAARLAAVRAGLLLGPDQDKLWPPLETAVRDAARQRQDWRDRVQKEGRPASPIDSMRRKAELSSARGEALKSIADAAAPLYASLSDDQKRRLNMFAHGRTAAMMGLGSESGQRGGKAGERGRGEGGYGGGRRPHDHHDGERAPRWRQGSMQPDDAGAAYGRGGRPMSDGFDRGAGLEDWRRL